ncbi:MAG: hypothetical protein QOJ90_957 [Actinomycetota bacterium]|nr:hypothetical protein [Actinomycetota bacterium]
MTEPTNGGDPGSAAHDPWGPPSSDPFAPPPAAAPPGWSGPPEPGLLYGRAVGDPYAPGAAPGLAYGWGAAPGPAYAWGPAPPPEPRTTNRWAIVALVTGLLPLVPVALGAGITALVQIHRRNQAGMWMAIVGIVGAVVWSVGAVAVAIGFFLSSVLPFEGGGLGRVDAAASTEVGTCLIGPGGELSQATVIDCASDHDGEVYRVLHLEGLQWPGSDEVDMRADDACYGDFAAYVGRSYDFSDYDYGYFLPDKAEWEAGEHRVVCVVMSGPHDTRFGSARGRDR